MVTYGTTPVNCLGNPTLIINNKKEDNQQRSLLYIIIYSKNVQRLSKAISYHRNMIGENKIDLIIRSIRSE